MARESEPQSRRPGSAGTEPVRVLLADNHAMFRRALMTLLQKDGGVRVVGEARRGREAERLARELEPDMVVMQVDQNIREAKDEISSILEASQRAPKVVILSMHGDPDFVCRTLEMGASAYVHKSGSLDDLLEAVRSAAASPSDEGMVVALPQRIVEHLANVYQKLGVNSRVEAVARGLSDGWISRVDLTRESDLR